ncbi:MAG: tetratricopeptide repeat protein, partial [Proteobacteria bacterium]|nr:tetratricopeptide repeat protein [Pseudomonadota bacterium]
MSEGDSPIDAALANAQRLFDQKDLDAAFNQFQEVLRLDIHNLTALTGMGNLLVMSQQFDEAIKVFTRATDVAPDELAPRSQLVGLLHQEGRFAEILDHLDILIEMDPANSHWYSISAYLFHSKGEPDKVRHYIDLGQKNAWRGIDWQAGTRYIVEVATLNAAQFG